MLSSATVRSPRRDLGGPNSPVGSSLVETVLRTVAASLPITLVHASRGKLTRAEPIAALYEQQKVHHVGALPESEDELCTWQPGLSESPDRLDALVGRSLS